MQLEREDRTEEDVHYFVVLPRQRHAREHKHDETEEYACPQALDPWAIRNAILNTRNSTARNRISTTSPDCAAIPKNML